MALALFIFRRSNPALRLGLLPVLFGALIFIAIFDRLPLALMGLTLSAYRLLSLPILLMILLLLTRRGRIPCPWTGDRATFFLLLGLLATMALSAFAAPYPEVALVHLLRYLEYAAIAYLAYAALRGSWEGEERYGRLLSWVVLASLALAALSVLSDFAGVTAFYRLFEADRPYVRHVGLLGEANYAGAKLAVLTPFVLHLGARYARSRRRGALAVVLGAALIVGAALFITGSRMGGLLALIPVGVFLARELRWLLRPRVLLIAVLVAGLFVGGVLSLGRGALEPAFRYIGTRYALLVTFLGSGEERLGAVEETSLRERLDVFSAGVGMLAERPLTGVGLAQFPLVVERYDPRYRGVYSHNTYLSALAELGLLGGVLFLLLCGRVLVLLLRRSRDGDFRFYLALSYAVLLLSFLFLHAPEDKYFWTLFIPLALSFEGARVGRNSGRFTSNPGP